MEMYGPIFHDSILFDSKKGCDVSMRESYTSMSERIIAPQGQLVLRIQIS